MDCYKIPAPEESTGRLETPALPSSMTRSDRSVFPFFTPRVETLKPTGSYSLSKGFKPLKGLTKQQLQQQQC